MRTDNRSQPCNLGKANNYIGNDNGLAPKAPLGPATIKRTQSSSYSSASLPSSSSNSASSSSRSCSSSSPSSFSSASWKVSLSSFRRVMAGSIAQLWSDVSGPRGFFDTACPATVARSSLRAPQVFDGVSVGVWKVQDHSSRIKPQTGLVPKAPLTGCPTKPGF
eukprot:GHVT01104937.1.p1 GENE.GHVT01104937.1~~GHVT01104937.1.p1  ORF type:complete len:164 (-),score=10.94 GHVT01104937.1:223-714(-)